MSRLVVVSNRIAPRIIKAAPAAVAWVFLGLKKGGGGGGWGGARQVTRMSH